jgi:hypothetical protein
MKCALVATIGLCMALFAACASLPVKQRAVLSLQASESALASAQDFERALCFNLPAVESGEQCTNPLAVSVGITDERHQNIAELFDQAYGIEKRADSALRAWTTGTAAPPTLATYVMELNQLLQIAKVLDPGAAMFLNYVQTAIDSAQAIVTLVGG